MTAGVKRRLEDPTEEVKSKISKIIPPSSQPITPSESSLIPSHFPACMHPQLARITASQRTPFEKRVWTALCQIPRGHFTTYGLLAAYLQSSPRAVGNALRRNPFAPEVPCHRVVATGGALGGFKGKWPRDGEGITIDEKKKLLRGEGIRLDGKGKVVGTPYSGFV
ncbi:6-O-methylguanine DNA methyltransferase [Ilyonectria sp. MPI-CAGE-AT-0026]|nr:6-O-methylguanine DNA methyltransferase [Ilyonectria sp. MPI-CAGE-AT-0026]